MLLTHQQLCLVLCRKSPGRRADNTRRRCGYGWLRACGLPLPRLKKNAGTRFMPMSENGHALSIIRHWSLVPDAPKKKARDRFRAFFVDAS